MAKYQVDFSGARNIIDPLEGVRNSLQQTNATLGQMIGQDEQRAERLRDEAYRRDALALQQTAAQRDTDKYNQELADRAFAQKTFATYNQTPTRDYSALPSQLTDTDRGKAVIEAMSLTPEELANPTMPSAIAKMKNQQILSDTHNESGQTMLESERFKNAVDATAKSTGGMAPLSMWEKQLAMESAERAAMTAKSELGQKRAEALLKDKGKIEENALKGAISIESANIRADGRSGGSGKSGGGKNDSKEPKTPSWEDSDKYREKLYKDYAYTKLWDAKDVDTVMDRAEALGVKPDDLNKIIKANTERKWGDNTFRTEQVLAELEAKKPVLTGGGYAGLNTGTSRSVSLDPMAGYAELLKQKDAAYRQAVANAANMPLTQADVLAARSAKGVTQLDELIAKLGATTGKAEVKPETREIPAPVTAVEEESVKTEAKQKVADAKKEFSAKDLFAKVSDKKDATAVNEDKTKFTKNTLMDVLGIPQTNEANKKDNSNLIQTAIVNPSWSDKSDMATQIMKEQKLPWREAWSQVEQKIRDTQVNAGVDTAAKALAQREGIPYEQAVQKIVALAHLERPRNTLQTTANPIMRQNK